MESSSIASKYVGIRQTGETIRMKDSDLEPRMQIYWGGKVPLYSKSEKKSGSY